MRKIIILATVIMWHFSLVAQMPGNTDWKEINTKHFKIIFPSEIEYRAQDLADFAELVHQYDTKTINADPAQVPLILDNKTSESNAYGRLAPREMWWYLSPMPSTALGSSEWLDLLMIHEYRHISQFDALDHGLTKIMHYLMGQAGQAMMMFWSVPLWFYEGDAVVQETQFTLSGRGRTGRFEMPVKATVFAYDDKKLNYYKYYLGSYKTYYPNQYYLGYYMVSYVNRNYGETMWAQILRRSAIHSYNPYALSRSLKKFTGMTTPRLFDSTMNDIKQIWLDKAATQNFTKFETVTDSNKRTWTNYYNPVFVSHDTILYLKSGFDDAQTLYMKDLKSGKEKKIMQISGGRFTYAKGKIVWAEQIPDARWNEVSYSDIVVADLATKKMKYLTRKKYYFSPAISPDGKYIAAVEYGNDLRAKLVLLDAQTGEKTDELFLPEISYIRNPSWDKDSRRVVFTQSNRENGTGIGIWDITNKTYKTLLPYSWDANIDRPVFWKNYILFSSDYNGTENILAYRINDGKIFRVVNSLYGASSPMVLNSSRTLLYKNYTPQGYDIVRTELTPGTWEDFDKNDKKIEYFRNERTINNIINLVGKEKRDTQAVIDYKPGKHMINPHSWLWGFTFDTDMGFSTAYASVYSTDYLYYTSSNAYMIYNNTGYIGAGLGITYKKFYPVLSLNLYQQYDLGRNLIDRYNLSTSASLPFNLSRHAYYRSLNITGKNTVSRYLDDNGVFSMYDYAGLGMSFGNYKKTAYRDVDTRWGQYFSMSGNYEFLSASSQFTIYGKLYLPGALRHDNIVLSAGYDKLNGTYGFSQAISLPRGIQGIGYNSIAKVSATYHVPLFYPDCGLRSVFYLKRVRSKLFYDYAIVDGTNVLNSYGLEILFDFNLFGLKFDLNAGIEISQTNQGASVSPVLINIPL